MKGYIKIEDILNYCEETVKIHERLIEKALDKDGPAANVSAAAYFMQQERIYKYDIPSMVKELGEADCGILDEHISTLALSTATFNILSRYGLTTVGELSEKTITELKKFRGLGAKQLEYLLKVLEGNGIKLKN